MDTYHVLEMIGEGSFGRVYKGRKKFSGQVVALKFIPKVGRSEKELRSLKREIDIMRGLKHPNIVLLLDSFETEREVVVVTEYAEGELFQILEDDGNLPESQVREIACQLVSALYYLHSHRILHRDMKPQNILLGKGGVVKLCDFGFARAMSVSTLVLTSIKGTPLYMSPELVEEKPYDHTADLWSLGCILYELHTGAPPFYTNSIFQLVQLIVRDPVKWPESMSPSCTSFLKGLLTKDPQKRLSWPGLLKHPFVADGVLVLSDASFNNPLTVSPSPDQQALKLQQAKEKAVPRCGEGKLLRKAREQRDKSKTGKRDSAPAGSAPVGSGTRDHTNKVLLRTAMDGRTPSKDGTVPSGLTDEDSVKPSVNLPVADQPQADDELEDRRGPISRDYAQEFPSVEVGPRQVLKQRSRGQGSLLCVRLENEDVDSDEEWQNLAKATDPESQTLVGLDESLVSRLKERLQASKSQLLDGMLEGACRIRQPLKVLSNLLTLTTTPEDSRQVAQEMGLPHFLFELIEEVLGNPVVKQQPWCVSVLGDCLTMLLVFWERDFDWENTGKRLEERIEPFVTILFHPDMAPIAALAAAVLALFAHRGVDVDLSAEKLMAVVEGTLLGSLESCVPPPRGWGLTDSLLVLLLQTLSERENCPISEFLDSSLWRLLWVRVSNTLEEMAPNRKLLSLTGLQVFLSLALFVFIRDPYSCVPLFASDDTNSLPTLCRLLTADCASEKEVSTEHRPAHPWSDPNPNSLSVMSCHLLCFPFALEVPDVTMEKILQSYHSCDIVSRLLQLALSLPLHLLEVPLSLLCHLLLCDPGHSVPLFMSSAETCGFFLPPAKTGGDDGDKSQSADDRQHGGPGKPGGRSASSLLAAFLQSEAQSSCAVELLSLVSQAARCLLLPPFSLLYVDPSLLRAALAHPDASVRAAACSLLGNLTPLAPQASRHPPLLLLFRDLIGRLQDQSLPVRRAACRAVGNWLGLIGQADSCDNSDLTKEADGPFTIDAKANPGKKTVQENPALPSMRADPEFGGWAESAQGATPALLPLLRDPDPLIRRHCCAALGNMAAVDGGGAALLQCDAPSQLLQVACADSQDAVQQAAVASLCLFGHQDALRQALVSLDADEKLRCVPQHAASPRQYSKLVSKLRPPVSP
ncbi:hypothetical protein MATL_G00044670 [Megalops atlanticus]|uniref:non-specific serine/threonine protein kinase n=1 Tax=Megalops atlanticus TaxID=7932 RepID=A0A9D3TAE9_MEGAT|nr:hypothetical protein MATL_G00044670 [Megalops atlanticus]